MWADVVAGFSGDIEQTETWRNVWRHFQIRFPTETILNEKHWIFPYES